MSPRATGSERGATAFVMSVSCWRSDRMNASVCHLNQGATDRGSSGRGAALSAFDREQGMTLGSVTVADQYIIRGGQEGYERLQLLARDRWPDTSALFERAGLCSGIALRRSGLRGRRGRS